MARVILLRAILVLLPFAFWFAWAAWARRTGRPMGATPWPWLAAAAGLLVGLSLMAGALFHRDNREDTYVPGEVAPDGHVTHSRSERP